MANRMCYICGNVILECMGSVHAGSFNKAVEALEAGKPVPHVHELCVHCATYYVNTTPEINAYPCPEDFPRGSYAVP